MASAADTVERTGLEWPSGLRIAFIALVYSLTHAVSLLNRGLYWDDWVFWKLDRQVLATAVAEMGSTWPASINDLFYYSQSGITFSRFLTFASMLVASLLLYDVLRRLPGVSRDAAMWIAMVFSVFPAFESRIALVMVGYPLSVALFMCSLWLLVRYGPRPPIPVRVLMAVLFFISFRTGSLLVFFAVVPLLVLIVHPPETRGLGHIVRRLLGYADQLILPVAYWVVTRVWFQPSGRYADYNTPGSANDGFLELLGTGLYNVLVGPIVKAAGSLPFKVPLAVGFVVCVVVALMLWRRPLQHSKRWAQLALTGLAMLVLAVAPYAAVGKAPGNYGWDTRHQLLVPFGGAFLTVAFVYWLVRGGRVSRRIGYGVLVLSIGISAVVHVSSYLAYERDWLKQRALIVAFQADPVVRDSHFILLEDETQDLDVTQRMFYEYTGMLAEAFGDETRYAVGRVYYFGNYQTVTHNVAYEPYYKAGDWAGGPPDCLVTIVRGDLDLRRTSQVLRLMILDWTDRAALDAELGRALSVHARPYTAADRHIDAYPPLMR
ncbi:MAG: hypothetical protein Q7W51_06615 [Coriobacteriia bacterium]|nr:hypothetical protein [Coriobacteriia bacterium]